MAFLGFILGALVLIYLTFAAVMLPYMSLLGGGLKWVEWLYWSFAVLIILLLWYLLFKYAPFTLALN